MMLYPFMYYVGPAAFTKENEEKDVNLWPKNVK